MEPPSEPLTYPMTHGLPPYLSREGEVLHLKEGWFSGCKPAAYIFFALGTFIAWIGRDLPLDNFSEYFLYWGCLVLPIFGVAFWMASRRLQWRFDPNTVQKMGGFRLKVKKEWPTEKIREVEMANQFYAGGRYSQLAPGLHLLIDGREKIDLGAARPSEKTREIGKAVADFYAVPFEDRSREEVIQAFWKRKLIIFVTALVLLAVIIIIQKIMESG